MTMRSKDCVKRKEIEHPGINTFWDLLQSVKAIKYCVEHWTGYLTVLTGRFERPIYLINSVNKYKFACLYSVHFLEF